MNERTCPSGVKDNLVSVLFEPLALVGHHANQRTSEKDECDHAGGKVEDEEEVRGANELVKVLLGQGGAGPLSPLPEVRGQRECQEVRCEPND